MLSRSQSYQVVSAEFCWSLRYKIVSEFFVIIVAETFYKKGFE